MRAVRNLLAVVTLLCLTSALTFATPITGSFDISGQSVQVTFSSIDFGPPLPNAAHGPFNVVLSTGGLVPLIPPGTTGLIQDLNSGAQPAGQAFPPPGFLAGFLTFGAPGQLLVLDLDVLYAGINPLGGLCVGAGSSCTPSLGEPPYSPFNLLNTATGSTFQFDASGLAYNNGDGDLTPDARWVGTFTAQFSGQTYQQVMQTLITQGFVQTSWSASISMLDQVPEPATFSLIGFGLLALGAVRFGSKKYRKS